MTLLTTNMQGFAHADLNPITLRPALGGFDLAFTLQLRTVTPNPKYWAVLNSAAVELASAQGQWKRLGQARPWVPLRIETTDNGLTSNAEFSLLLSVRQLAAIEDLRASGDLLVKFSVFGEGGPVGDPQRRDPVFTDHYTQLPQSVWVRELNTSKALDVLLLEVPMPFVEPGPFQRATEDALASAQQLFLAGNYTESVARCRSAISAMARRIGRDERWTGPAFDSLKEKRQDLSKDERELILEAALLHFTHLGAHPEAVEITRQEAKLALSVTASVLAFRAG